MADHVALHQPMTVRKDYLTILAAVVGADGRVAGREISVLEDYLNRLDIAVADRQTIIQFSRQVDPATVIGACERVRGTGLHSSLISDLLYIAYSDDQYSSAEREVIESIARMMGVSWRQLDAMELYAHSVLRGRTSRTPSAPGGDDRLSTSVRQNVLGGIAAIVAPAMAISVLGMGVGPIATARGLRMLGLGAIPVGALVAALISVGAFFAVRWVMAMMQPPPRQSGTPSPSVSPRSGSV